MMKWEAKIGKLCEVPFSTGAYPTNRTFNTVESVRLEAGDYVVLLSVEYTVPTGWTDYCEVTGRVGSEGCPVHCLRQRLLEGG